MIGKARPIGAMCLYDDCDRPALPNRLYPHLATLWCGDEHRLADLLAERRRRAERKAAQAARYPAGNARRYPHRRGDPHATARPIGALCVYGNCVRTARPNRRYPHLATRWCSDEHKQADTSARATAVDRQLANRARDLLGLPAGRGATFSRPELEAIVRRLERLVPLTGTVAHPARGRAPRRRPA